MKTFCYGQDHLTASLALGLANKEIKGIFSPETVQKINHAAKAVAQIAQGEKAVYGINTGFGPLCTTRISADDTTTLQENLLKSHAVGVGEYISEQISRLMLVLKIHALAQGFSGVRMETVERIAWMLENDVIPVVPEQGSVGASGDLDRKSVV